MRMYIASCVGHLRYVVFNVVNAVPTAYVCGTSMCSCSCPGVFSGQGCGAKLKWVQFREGKGCWGCSSWPACDHKEAATERLATPQVTLEAVSKELFKVFALPMLRRVAYTKSIVPLSAPKCPSVPFGSAKKPCALQCTVCFDLAYTAA